MATIEKGAALERRIETSDDWRAYLGGYLMGLSVTDRFDLPTQLREELRTLSEAICPHD